tara:strand:- start:191 stop:772 length:582 start_codon:yes stop_codon:yes gene_type:complete
MKTLELQTIGLLSAIAIGIVKIHQFSTSRVYVSVGWKQGWKLNPDSPTNIAITAVLITAAIIILYKLHNKNNKVSDIIKTYTDFRFKSLSTIFKPSNFSKAHSVLKNNNLIPQAMLLKQAKRNGYQVNSKKQRDLEISMLKSQKVDIMAALSSITRFQQAKDICLNNELEKGALFFDFYIDLYGYYVKNYNEL